MSFVFFVEVDNKQPKYLMKTTSSQDTISIYRSTETDVVLVGEHRDRIYQNKIEKCKDLDCSQFYTSAFATGAVSLCADCEEFIPGGGGGGESGPCSAYGILNSVNFTPPSAATPLNNSNASGSLSSYNSWVSSPTNQSLARSGYWLGMNTCNGGGSQFQCLVSCSTGAVAGCYSNSGSGSVGDVHVIGGSSYQVYDAMQLVTGGMPIPSNGTVPLLSGNPTNSGTYSGNSCGRVITTIDFGGSGGGDSNCLTDHGNNESCKGCMKTSDASSPPWTGTVPKSSPEQFPNSIALFGDYTNTVLGTGSDCYSVGNSQTSGNNGAKASTSVARFALGGSTTGGTTPTTLGAAGLTASGSCGECIGKILSDSGGSKGPGCCLSACNRIGINGAPTTTDGGSTWSEGSAIWSNFWPDDNYDQNFRNPGDNNTIKSAWIGCPSNPSNTATANSIYTLPCNPRSICDNGNARGVITLQTIYQEDFGDKECCQSDLYPMRSGCIPDSEDPTVLIGPVINCGNGCAPSSSAASGVGFSLCQSKRRIRSVIDRGGQCLPPTQCLSSVDANPGVCGAKMPITYEQFYTKVVPVTLSNVSEDVLETTKGQIYSQLGSDAPSCTDPGTTQSAGPVISLTVKGVTSNRCNTYSGGGFQCPKFGTTSDLFSPSTIRTMMGMGYWSSTDDGETVMSSDDTSACCSLIIQSPWLPQEGTEDSWNYKDCQEPADKYENWVSTVFDKNSSCLSNPCDTCP